jgi:hypothetical protein
MATYALVCNVLSLHSSYEFQTLLSRNRQEDDTKYTVQFLPYGRSIGSWICLTHKTYTCHTLQCCACPLYIFFRTSNYVQQRKTYTRKTATVHLNCSTVPCNTLCEGIAAAIPCNTLCARIAAAVWRKTRDVICHCECECECATLGCSTFV